MGESQSQRIGLVNRLPVGNLVADKLSECPAWRESATPRILPSAPILLRETVRHCPRVSKRCATHRRLSASESPPTRCRLLQAWPSGPLKTKEADASCPPRRLPAWTCRTVAKHWIHRYGVPHRDR